MHEDEKIIEVMRTRGGPFVEHLAYLWLYADPYNREKIRRTWYQLFAKYANFLSEEVTK